MLTAIALFLLAGVVLFSVFTAPPFEKGEDAGPDVRSFESGEQKSFKKAAAEVKGKEAEDKAEDKAEDEASSQALSEQQKDTHLSKSSKAERRTEARQSSQKEGSARENRLININSASAAELMSVKGIGEVKARAIIEYREKYGPFPSVDALINIKGIGEKTLAKIRGELSV